MSLIKKRFEEFKDFAPQNTRLEIRDTDEMFSYPDGRIVFGLKVYRKYQASVPQEMEPYLITFFLAHEIAHQLQFQADDGAISTLNSVMDRMILEGQADVLTGFVLGVYFLKDNFYMNEENRRMIDQKTGDCNIELIYFFRLMSEFGIEENTLGTHPSKSNRVRLMKEGFNFGAIATLSNANEIANNGRTDKAFQKLIADAYKRINYKVNGIMNWSAEVTKRILNHHPLLAKNVIFRKDKSSLKIDSVSFDIPHYEFDLYYENVSTKKISAEFEIYSMYFKKDHKELVEYHTKADAKYFNFDLEPGQTKNIKGYVAVIIDKENPFQFTFCKDLDLQLVFPQKGELYSNFSMSFAESNSQTEFIESKEALSFIPDKEPLDINFETELSSLIRNVRFSPENIIAGMGNGGTTDPNIINNKIYKYQDHLSRIKLGKNLKVEISIDRSNNRGNFIIYNTKDTGVEGELDKIERVMAGFDKVLADYDKPLMPRPDDIRAVSYEKEDFVILVFFMKRKPEKIVNGKKAERILFITGSWKEY